MTLLCLGEIYGWNMTGHLFDMLSPDENFEIADDSAIFTIGTVEQLASNFEPYLQFFLKRSPKLCIRVESTIEQYEENILIDYLAMKFQRVDLRIKGSTTAFRCSQRYQFCQER